MINGVEFHAVDQLFDIRDLNNCHARGFQQRSKSCHNAIQISHMSQHIVGLNNVGLTWSVFDLLSQRFIKKLNSVWMPCSSATCAILQQVRRPGLGHRPACNTATDTHSLLATSTQALCR
jgi:hypothetical protein